MVASRYKLKPSIYAFFIFIIDPALVGIPSAVKYVGRTAIRVRSCKHDKSTSRAHLTNMLRLCSGVDCREEWKKIAVDNKGKTRPIINLRPDGGPD